MTQQTQDQTWNEELTALAELAERGELEPIAGTTMFRNENAPALTEKDLLAIVQGRPRAEERQLAKKTWRVRTTQELDLWAAQSAHAEHLNVSALIRKAVVEYLGRHHGNLAAAHA